MAYDQRSLDDYVDVATRLAEFRERHPEGSLQPLNPAQPFEIRQLTGVGKTGKEFTATFVIYTAAAYRDRDDPHPGIGCAWEVFPGRTPYTLGSELMNAETSAWGRAIVAALASDSKRGVLSREEVRNRRAEHDEPPQQQAAGKPKRTRAKTTGADHERLVQSGQPAEKGRVDGAQRTRGPIPPEDDQWAGRPAGPRISGAREGRRYIVDIVRHFERLGITDREERLIITGQLAGAAGLTSTNDLSEDQQRKVVDVLSKAKDIATVQAAINGSAKPA
jgi:hypothetical protein